jgi:osmoprotectant transport system permease protein
MGNKKSDTIVVGSYNSSEQTILGNMLAILVENNTNLTVERKFNLGGSGIIFTALRNGKIDMYPEYTGTALLDIMKADLINDSNKAYEAVSEYYKENYDITWLEPLGFNDTYAIAVRQDTAQEYNLETLSDLAKVGDKLALGCTLEFSNREDVSVKSTGTF